MQDVTITIDELYACMTSLVEESFLGISFTRILCNIYMPVVYMPDNISTLHVHGDIVAQDSWHRTHRTDLI